ncbi:MULTISPECIES: hypothetical protein [unclassified Bradyrhizobium]|uniref:hypothetical protein n=1 Tax=unclassified Bradyrhizobium TaxID=2631580 RepID=UPI00339B2BB0
MSKLARELNAIHDRLIAGRPTATLELFEAALDPLIGFLRRELRLTEEDAYDRAVDAIMTHVHKPGIFDASKSSLWTFLCLVAQRRAQDFTRKGKRRGKLEEKYKAGIEDWGVQANNLNEKVEIAMDAETIMRLHGQTIAKNGMERKVLDLLLEEEKEVAVYAAAMELGADEDTAAEVKRVQDRIKLRLKKVGNEL